MTGNADVGSMTGTPRECLTLLRGHTSFETAYVVDGYPYGRKLRTKKAYWVETATKGAHAREMRLVTRTLDPKTGRWNKPHASVYTAWCWLYRDERNGHAHGYGMTGYDFPRAVARLKAVGLYGQLAENEQADFVALEEHARSRMGDHYADWDVAVKRAREAIAAHGVDKPDLYTLSGCDGKGDTGRDGYIYEPTFKDALAFVKATEHGLFTLPPLE